MLKSHGDISADEAVESEGEGLNPFCVLGPLGSPMRMMFAPLEVATFLPAYAIDTFHGRRRR